MVGLALNPLAGRVERAVGLASNPPPGRRHRIERVRQRAAQNQARRDDPDVWGMKRAIIAAQWLRLEASDAVRHGEDLASYACKITRQTSLKDLSSEQLDQVQKWLGRRLREALLQKQGDYVADTTGSER